MDLRRLLARTSSRGRSGRALSDRQALLETLIRDKPPFHLEGEALTASWSVQVETLRYFASVLEPGLRTLETGCGQTTVVFAIAGSLHTCITPDAAEAERVREYCARLGVGDGLTFVVESSETALPRGAGGPELDHVLIDGAHAFPAPILDWHYTARRLKIGGLLAVDDYKMPSVKVLVDFLRGEEEWNPVTIVQNTAFFRKVGECKHLIDWKGQRINADYPGY